MIGIPPQPPQGKGKQTMTTKVTTKKKKRSRSDIEAETAMAVAQAAERAEQGGHGSSLRIGESLSPAQRQGLEQVESFHRSPRGPDDSPQRESEEQEAEQEETVELAEPDDVARLALALRCSRVLTLRDVVPGTLLDTVDHHQCSALT